MLLATGLVLALTALPSAAQEYDAEASQDAWAASAIPGKAHAYLAEKTGDWDIVATMWMAPGAEPMVNTSTSHGEMILGGRFLQEHVTGETMGMPFEGLGLTGFDNTTHEVTSIWIDSMGTVMVVMTGLYEKFGEPMELFGDMVYTRK